MLSRMLLIFANITIAVAWFAMACENYEEKKWDRMMMSMYLCFISTASMYYICKY